VRGRGLLPKGGRNPPHCAGIGRGGGGGRGGAGTPGPGLGSLELSVLWFGNVMLDVVQHRGPDGSGPDRHARDEKSVNADARRYRGGRDIRYRKLRYRDLRFSVDAPNLGGFFGRGWRNGRGSRHGGGGPGNE